MESSSIPAQEALALTFDALYPPLTGHGGRAPTNAARVRRDLFTADIVYNDPHITDNLGSDYDGATYYEQLGG